MLQMEQKIFVGLAQPANRVQFHPATVREIEGGVVVELDEPIDAVASEQLSAGSSVGLYFEHRNKFMQQPVHIDAVTAGEAGLTIGCTPVGEPISAENRAYYRTVAIFENLHADVDGLEDCPLLDVSSAGCSIRSRRVYRIGENVSLAIAFEGTKYRGAARIQSSKPLGPKEFRYGLYCAESKVAASTLRGGLQRISTCVQRKQLRRLADAA